MTEDQIRRRVWTNIWKSRGEPPVDGDYAYWVREWPGLEARGIEINHPNYADDRMLGWQAGGADVPRFGPWAVPPTPYHDVPPYPGDAPAPPAPTPPPDDRDREPHPPAPEVATVLEQRHYAVMGEFLALRTQGAKLAKELAAIKKLVMPKKPAAKKP